MTTTLPDLDSAAQPDPSGARLTVPALDVVVPVYNEEADLESCVVRLHAYLDACFPYHYRITVADNASTDRTLEVAERLAASYPEVDAVHLELKGRGRALREVWSASDATVLAYMDVDLSTDLTALLPLVAPLLSGHSELAIGSRLARGSRVVRGPKRELISRCYNLILRGTLAAGFSDAQCGFKAIRGDVAKRLLPLVEDTGWFFDTEMLVLAERAGLRIHEVPVDWVDDPDSRVDIVATATADLRGVIRVGKALASGKLPLADLKSELRPASRTGQLIRFGVVGIVSTLAYVVLYVLLRGEMGAQPANLVALLVTAIGNTSANRGLTFGVHGSAGWMKHQGQGLAVFLLALALTSGSLAALAAASTGTHRGLEILVVIAAGLLATAARFTLLRRWWGR